MKAINENIYVSDQDLTVLGIAMGARMTVIRLSNNNLIIHSPNKFSESLAAEVTELGECATIFSPNKMHNLYVEDWIRCFPKAKAFAPFSIADRNSYTFLEPSIITTIENQWQNELEIVYLDGMPALKEYVLYHPKSKTLIVTDCIFNLHNRPGITSNILLKLNGAHNRTGPSRLFKAAIKDKELFAQSLQKILQWDFETIILSHGDIIEANGKNIFLKAFKQYLPLHEYQ